MSDRSDTTFRCLIGLGANLGDRRATLEAAIAQISRLPGSRLVASSAWYETAPAGGPQNQPSFLNGAACLMTSLTPRDLLQGLLQIELALGRVRREHWGPRSIDLDLLLYDRLVIDEPGLVVPHPRMAWRRFVLQPAAEIAPEMVHPTTGQTVGALWEHLATTPCYLAIAGPIGAGKTTLAKALVQRHDAVLVGERLDLERLDSFYADPTGEAWATELEFLRSRSELLGRERPLWSGPPRLVISDFWFDQSLAFARAWLPAERVEPYQRRWQEARRRVVRPRLLVLLDAPAEQLLQRIHRRGRRCEQSLSADKIEQIRVAILHCASAADAQPVLRLTADDAQAVLEEVSAAVEAMR